MGAWEYMDYLFKLSMLTCIRPGWELRPCGTGQVLFRACMPPSEQASSIIIYVTSGVERVQRGAEKSMQQLTQIGFLPKSTFWGFESIDAMGTSSECMHHSVHCFFYIFCATIFALTKKWVGDLICQVRAFLWSVLYFARITRPWCPWTDWGQGDGNQYKLDVPPDHSVPACVPGGERVQTLFLACPLLQVHFLLATSGNPLLVERSSWKGKGGGQ